MYVFLSVKYQTNFLQELNYSSNINALLKVIPAGNKLNLSNWQTDKKVKNEGKGSFLSGLRSSNLFLFLLINCMIIRIMPTHTIDIFACGYFQVYLTQDYKSLREMIYVNLEFISMYCIIFLTIQANGRSQMDQVGKKTKKRQKGRRGIC